MSIEPTNLTAQLHHRAAGNPPSTLPDAAISNCFPGLEFDFRNIWRRLLEGIELHEASGLVVSADEAHADLAGLYLLEVAGVPTRMDLIAPTAQGGGFVRREFMEWSNALAEVVAEHSGEVVACTFDSDRAIEQGRRTAELRVRRLFVQSAATQGQTAQIDEVIAAPGELTQSLCSPWQNDYVECGCYYWAASRPDYVNVEPTAQGAAGEEWLAVSAETYELLFRGWQDELRFIVGGRDSGGA